MNEPRKYRKLPVEVEAMQFDGTPESATAIINWVLSHGGRARWVCVDSPCFGDAPHVLQIDTLEGTMTATAMSHVIRGVKDEFYPCQPDIFNTTYEVVS